MSNTFIIVYSVSKNIKVIQFCENAYKCEWIETNTFIIVYVYRVHVCKLYNSMRMCIKYERIVTNAFIIVYSVPT